MSRFGSGVPGKYSDVLDLILAQNLVLDSYSGPGIQIPMSHLDSGMAHLDSGFMEFRIQAADLDSGFLIRSQDPDLDPGILHPNVRFGVWIPKQIPDSVFGLLN